MILQDFYAVLQSAIGKTVQLSNTLSEKEWNEIFGLAKKQALVGIMFEGCLLYTSGSIATVETIVQTTDFIVGLLQALNRDTDTNCLLYTSSQGYEATKKETDRNIEIK